MGYTHYFNNKRAFTDSEWKEFSEKVMRVIANSDILIVNGNGEEGSTPTFGEESIEFNGNGDDSHETAYMPKGAIGFEFCKTAQKPYDKVVVEMYKIAKEILGSGIELSSDGGMEVFD